MTTVTCDYCTFEIPLEFRHCPHCCYGLQCPNVRNAKDDQPALEQRYQAALADARMRDCEPVVRQFESEVGTARAVLGTTLKKLLPVAKRERDLFATYYDLADLQFQRSPPSGWIDFNKRRPQAEVELLGSHKNIDQLHYAALSLDGKSLPHYGDCTVWLREHMVAHRASFFQENSAVCFDKNGGKFPPGYRSTWDERAKLCVAKLASQLTTLTQSGEFPKLIVRAGKSTSPQPAIDDEFVEIQIFGEMTFKTFERVELPKAARSPSPKPSKASKIASRVRHRKGMAGYDVVYDYCVAQDVDCEFV